MSHGSAGYPLKLEITASIRSEQNEKSTDFKLDGISFTGACSNSEGRLEKVIDWRTYQMDHCKLHVRLKKSRRRNLKVTGSG